MAFTSPRTETTLFHRESYEYSTSTDNVARLPLSFGAFSTIRFPLPTAVRRLTMANPVYDNSRKDNK